MTDMTDTSSQKRVRKVDETQEWIVLGSSPLDDSSPPSRLQIAPWGEVSSDNGSFVIDAESAGMVIGAHARQGTDVPIDYEHQSLGGEYASPNGQAPAAGWIRSLEAVSPQDAGDGEAGLFAEVTWTEAGRRKLAAREYRYLSPVVIVRKSDRRVVALHSVALTNKPAIAGMKPIVNRDASTPSSTSEAIGALRRRLALSADADEEAVLVAASERLASLLETAARRDACERVEAAMREGRLTSAQRDWAVAFAMKDPREFERWRESAPTVVVPGRTTPPETVRSSDRTGVIASARASYRAEPALELLTTESAWVRQSLREAGLDEKVDASTQV